MCVMCQQLVMCSCNLLFTGDLHAKSVVYLFFSLNADIAHLFTKFGK